MKIFAYSLGELAANCYIVSSGKDCVIIDPADAPEFIAEEIQRKGLMPKMIISTHGHFDHILAVAGLKMIFNIPFLIHREDEFLVNNMQYSAGRWLNRKVEEPNPKIDGFLKNKDKIKIGNDFLEVIETPGHTPGSVCFYGKSSKIIFAGDLLFKGGIGRTDFSYSSQKNLNNSLKKIFKLPENTAVYSGHGENTTIGMEMKNFG